MGESLQQRLNETLAVLVLYKKLLHKSPTFQTLNESARKNGATISWFIYDNSPVPDPGIPKDSHIVYIHDASNPGVSKAYNEGFSFAKKTGKKQLLLLDQDTHFNIDSLEKYNQAIAQYPDQICFVPQLEDAQGIISPFQFKFGNGIRVKSVKEGVHFLEKLHFVNSGLMISTQAFQLSGGYDQELPLDFSDFAFVERLKSNHTSFVLLPIKLNHDLASSSLATQADALHRFSLYAKAARIFKRKYFPDNNLILFRVWLRAIKLSLKFCTLKFLTKEFRACLIK